MKLVDVYTAEEASDILWALLAERTPEANISHQGMPSPKRHREFVASKPYLHWYLIDVGAYAGAVYLTHSREIGVGVLNRYRGHRYGVNAVRMLMQQHPGRFLANINPRNVDSIQMFLDLGFRQLQVTYELGAL